MLVILFMVFPPSAQARPQAVFPETSRDFGEFTQDLEQSHAFIVKNTGTDILQILEVDPDCSCTAPSYDKEIPPGAEGKIVLKLKSFSVKGPFEKKTRIRTNDPDKPQAMLILTGVSKPMIEILPSHIIRFKGPVKQKYEAQVRLISYLAYPLEIKEIRNNLPASLGVSLKVEDPGKVYVITLKNLAEQPGKYAGKVEVLTNFDKRPMIWLRVFADLQPDSAKP
jgi:hypothetical protein